MKPEKKIIFIAFAALVIILSAIYAFVILQGRAIIISKLEEATGKKVTIGDFRLSPPFDLQIKDLNIEGLLKVESVFISPSIPYLMIGKIGLNRVVIVRPRITYKKEAARTAVADSSVAPAAVTEKPKEKKQALHFTLKRFDLKDGQLVFLDNSVGQEGIKIVVKDINFHLTNLYTFPFSAVTRFDLRGRIPWHEGEEEGRIEAKGWLDLFKKNMQASLKITGIDGIYLYPYYSGWVDMEKVRVEKAKLSFSSDIQGLNNDVTAKCHLELTDLVRKSRPPEEQENKADRFANAFLGILQALNQGKIVFDFTVRTKMDSPQFGIGNIKMAVQDKIAKAREANRIKAQDIFTFPIRLLEGTLKSATELSKAAIDGTFAVGNGVKEVVGTSFKKEKLEN